MELRTDLDRSEALFASFDALAQKTFHLSFRAWREAGFWSGAYLPHALCEGERVLANVSVNRMALWLDGRELNAIQLGTVMTDEACRGQGLSRRLLQTILETYRDSPVYLFANRSVLNFYPKFGFERVEETVCTAAPEKRPGAYRRIDPGDARDREKLGALIASSVPQARLAVRGNLPLSMFYCCFAMRDCLYELPDLSAAAVAEWEGGRLLLHQIYADHVVDAAAVAGTLLPEAGAQVRFGFTPRRCSAPCRFAPKRDDDDALFMRPPLPMAGLCFPTLSHA